MQVVATGFGDPSVLKVVPTNHVAPKAGEVVIDVRAAGVNHVDYTRYADPAGARKHGEGDNPFPMKLGVEVSGVISAVGQDACGPAGPVVVGDEVIAYRVSGGYTDRLVVPGSAVVPKPTALSWAQAAVMMLDGTTAAHALAAVTARAGQTVLVHGASGGVGSLLAQLARFDGIRIVGTTSEKHFDRVSRFGATPVTYGPGLRERVEQAAPGGLDAAIDLVGTTEAGDVSLALVSDRSRIATIVDSERAKREGFQALGGSPGQDEAGIDIRMNARLRLSTLVQASLLAVEVARTFTFAEVQQAHESLARGGAGGRIVLTPAASQR
jgi:NADPH2:quinone reductase